MDNEIKKLKTGTTTVGLVADGAVVLAAEMKATMGYLVASKVAEKILQLDDYIGMSIAGSVGDAQTLERYIKAELKLYKLREERPISVEAAATLTANILYARSMYPYIVQLIIGGYDDSPKLFSLAPDGSLMEEKEYFSTGSGSPMAFGVLENEFKPGISVEDAKLLAVRAIKAAVARDIASGGKGINVTVIDSKGFKRISQDEIKKLTQ